MCEDNKLSWFNQLWLMEEADATAIIQYLHQSKIQTRIKFHWCIMWQLSDDFQANLSLARSLLL